MTRLMKADVTCRRCKHSYCYHVLAVNLVQGGMIQPFIKPIDVVPCNGLDFVTGQTCGCLEFEPIDNLEYLEWKAKQKENERTIDDTIW